MFENQFDFRTIKRLVTQPELYPCPVVKFKSVNVYGAPQPSVLIELPSHGSVQPPDALKHNLPFVSP